jgi:predicted metal-dependent phosphoesterase TrpH
MIIDLHIHSKNSDGSLSVKRIFEIVKLKNISLLSITDHDSIICQEEAMNLAKQIGIRYISGVELNVSFKDTRYPKQKPIALDFLGYNFDLENSQIQKKLEMMAQYRQRRAMKILEKLNVEFKKNQIKELTQEDMINIQKSVNGVFGRPHIADYLVKKGIVKDRNEAFNKYLMKCNVPKYPFTPMDATKLVRNAGGKIVLAHPNDPRGTSLRELTKSLEEQTEIITQELLQFIDGIECWHSRSDLITINNYVKYSKEHGLLMTGGSDCHQKPIIMGTVNVPSYVANQF